MKIFVFGSSILSSYWNGAATYYRGCYKYLSRLGHKIVFAEPDAYGRQQHLDAEDFSYVESIVYRPGEDVGRMLDRAADDDIVIKHSGVGVDDETIERRILELQPERIIIFWDVDAAATLVRLQNNSSDPFQKLVPQYDAIFTYGGGPSCRQRYLELGARSYFSIYNGLDPDTHFPVPPDPEFICDLAFIGNRLPDRESRVEELFLHAAELAPEFRFLLGGEGWGDKRLPANVRYIGHVPTSKHNSINCSARMVMNINRISMAQFGFSPPTRIFEVAGAAGCLLCDDWPGIGDCFDPGKELLVVANAGDVVNALKTYDGPACRRLGNALYQRALRDHTYAQRAMLSEKALQICVAARIEAGRL